MGYFDNVKERLDKQFISVKDGITFIFHQDKCTYQDAFNLVMKTLIFDQTHLLIIDGLKLKTILICCEQDPNSHNAYMTVETLTVQLKQTTLNGTAKDIDNIGFGKKRFYEQLVNIGFVFDDRLLFEAQSPDIDYSDCETEGDGFAYYNGLPKEYEALKRSHDKLQQSQQAKAPNSDQLIKELAAAKAQIADLESKLALALADKPADEQPQGIARYNADKAIYIATGKALAGYIWSMDTTKAIRTGDMVQQVRQVMHSIDTKLLPDDRAIRSWLSDIAPDYAKKGGQPPNDAPNEIPLTMKK